MRRFFRRGGFTLVEVMFAGLITAGLVGICYSIFIGQHKTAYKIDKKYEALSSALTAAEHIQKDLAQIVTLPLKINDKGESERRFGDHTAPVKIAWSGRSVAFYVPESKAMGGEAPTASLDKEEEAKIITYALVPAKTKGLYNVKRIFGKVEAEEQAKEAKGHTFDKVTVRDLRFRLLDPKAATKDDRSPDGNYYLETVIQGADATGDETRTLSLVSHLAYPSVMQKAPTLKPEISYASPDPLVTPPDVFTLTPEEKATLDELNKAADEFRNGGDPKALEEKVRDIINRNAGKPGHGPVFDNSGRFIPQVGKLTLMNPDSKGPLVLTDNKDTNVVIPPNPATPPASGAEPPKISMGPRPNNLTITGGMAHYREDPAGSGNWVLVNTSNINISGQNMSSKDVDNAFGTANNWANQNGVGQWVTFDRSKVGF